MKKLNLLLLLFLLGIMSCKKETDLETDIQPNNIETELLLNEISGPSITEINLREYSSAQAADFFAMDFISSSPESVSAETRSEVDPFLLKANETLYKNTAEDQVELLIKTIGYPAWDIGQVLGIYKENGVESAYVPAFASDKKTIKSLIRFDFSKEETVFVRIYDARLYTLIYNQHPKIDQAIHINSLFYYFSNQQELAAKERDCGAGDCHWVVLSNGRFCLWKNGFSGGYTLCDCCTEGEPLDQGNEDLADWFNSEITPFIRFPYRGGTGGGNSINNPVNEIINTSDEQALIAYLMERFGWDATHPNTLSLVTFPNYMRTIIQYNGTEAQVQRFIDFMNTHGFTAQLSTAELNILINLEPQGRGILNIGTLNTYLNSHNDDAVSSFVLHEILRLADNNPELTSAAPSILDNFYRGLTPEVRTWIEGSDDNFRKFLNLYLIEGGPFEEAEARRNTVTDVINMNVEHGLDFELGTIIFLANNIEIVDILNSLTDGNSPLTMEERAGAAFFLHAMENNFSDLPADDPNLNAALEQFWPGPTIPTLGLELGLDLALQVEQEVMFLREVHKNDPSWTNNWLYAHAIKKVFSGTTHTLLQLCGLFEGPGIICDGVDALFYLVEGDGKNAAISSLAMVPFLGLTAPGQRAYKRITSALGGTVGLRYTIDAAGVVHFSYSGQLRLVIGKVAGHQAHHMVPWALNSHEVIQRAARHGWHPNDFINGINLPLARHNGSHEVYTNAIRARLEDISQIAGNNGAQTVQLLDKFAADLFGVIQSSTAHINSTTMSNLVNSIPIP